MAGYFTKKYFAAKYFAGKYFSPVSGGVVIISPNFDIILISNSTPLSINYSTNVNSSIFDQLSIQEHSISQLNYSYKIVNSNIDENKIIDESSSNINFNFSILPSTADELSIQEYPVYQLNYSTNVNSSIGLFPTFIIHEYNGISLYFTNDIYVTQYAQLLISEHSPQNIFYDMKFSPLCDSINIITPQITNIVIFNKDYQLTFLSTQF